MVAKFSAGLLLFRYEPELEVLLGHMGGPLWARKDAGAWSIPKGEYLPDQEQARDAAAREFTEELGIAVPQGDWIPLGEVEYGSGGGRKRLTVWALYADPDLSAMVPGTFEMEWPPRSGQIRRFPEIDRAEWFAPVVAHEKLGVGQRPFLDRLAEQLPV